MNTETIAILRETWRAVAPVADDAMTLFYGRLFAIDPSTRPLFGDSEMAKQRKKLGDAITLVIDGLEHAGDLVPVLAALGRRHAGYGVSDGHYDSVGAALLWTSVQEARVGLDSSCRARLDRSLQLRRGHHAPGRGRRPLGRGITRWRLS